MIHELREEMYLVIERVKMRAELSERHLDVYDMSRIEALTNQIEVFTKQHHSNCQ